VGRVGGWMRVKGGRRGKKNRLQARSEGHSRGGEHSAVEAKSMFWRSLGRREPSQAPRKGPPMRVLAANRKIIAVQGLPVGERGEGKQGSGKEIGGHKRERTMA